jgi:Tfp pilus assembly PilM family ATPase
MAKRTGIELLPHACRIVEVASRARLFGGSSPEALRVRAFREIPCSAADPETLAAELRQALKGLQRRASVAVWGLRSSHQALLLPPAAPADLEAVARREARTIPGGLPAPPLADAAVAGALRDGRRQTGYVAVSAEDLRARLQPLIDAGVTIESVTTPALAHASLVRQRRALLPDAVVAVLSVNAQATAITVVHSNVVLFARELPWGDQTGRPGDGQDGASRAAFASRVAAEFRRSLIYLRQSQKVDVSRVLVCGDLADLRSLTGPLADELALDVETLDVGEDLDLSKLPEPSDSLRSRLGAWRTALALAAETAPFAGLRGQDAGPAAASSSLAPRVAAAAVAGVLIVAAAWGVLSYLSANVTARQERLRLTIGVLEPELRRRDEERRRAAVAAARETALGAFASQGPRLARVLEAFSLAAPADVALSMIRVEPGVASWRLVVEGQAEGADAGAAHATFTRFLKALEAARLVGRTAAPPSLRARTSDPADAADQAPAGAPSGEAARPVQAIETPRPAAAGPAYIEVARDGRLYRIPLRRQSGTLETSRRAEEARRLQEAALVREAATPTPSGTTRAGAPGRQPASVVEFTLRYEVPK